MLLIAASGLGCTASTVGGLLGAGAGAVAYVRGELEARVERPYTAVVQATESAITDLQFVQEEVRKDALRANFDARNADDKAVNIRIEKMTQTITTVKIRIGVFGDQKQSRLVLEQIKANL